MSRKGNLKKKFGIPPFSVFDTKQEYWQKRKRKWRHIGIKGEIGREVGSESNLCSEEYNRGKDKSISVFDETLTEIMYKWFCPDKGKILDPFAGGSVRGIIASGLGYTYRGIELREEQVESNRKQWDDIEKRKLPKDDIEEPKWISGDSEKVLKKIPDSCADFIFTCPPYYDLEVYSNERGELSNFDSYDEFLEKYKKIISLSLDKLKNNRFVSFVVSNLRDDDGFYYDLVGDTIKSFEKNDVKLYNEIILINSVGSLPVRVGTFFPNYRKVGKMHQNILVFYKGNPDRIPDNFPKKVYSTAKDKTKDLDNFF